MDFQRAQNICMRWNYLLLSKAYGRQTGREKNLKNLADTQTRCGYISGISIISSQGLHRLWMFGDTRQAMGLHLRSTSHGGHGYLRGGGSVTSVPLTHYSALWLAGLGGGILYHIMSSSHLHSSIALLFSFYLTYTNIASMLILI